MLGAEGAERGRVGDLVLVGTCHPGGAVNLRCFMHIIFIFWIAITRTHTPPYLSLAGDRKTR
jgi:hypothetical protein